MKNKKIINGNGNITLRVLSGMGLKVVEIEGERPAGTDIMGEDLEEVNEHVFTEISIDDVERIKSELMSVAMNSGGSIEFFDGWTIDFSKYHAESVMIYLKAMMTLESLQSEIDTVEGMVNSFSETIPETYGELLELKGAYSMNFETKGKYGKYKVTVEKI